MIAEPDDEEQLTLRLPVHPASVPVGRQAAVQFAEECGATPETLWRVRLAVSEALTNVILHAHPGGSGDGEHLVLVGRAAGPVITVTVRDAGVGLRPRTDSPGMGFGLSLLADAADAVALDAVPGGGTSVQMSFPR